MNRSFPTLRTSELPTLSASAKARYFTFFFSYFIQGLVPGLFLMALVNYFGKHGFSVGRVGSIMALVGLPWTLQFVWGPVVDGYRRSVMGGRRFWQVAAFSASSLCLLSIFLLVRDPLAHWRFLTALLVLHSACASLMDVSVDGLMIDHVPEAEKGRAGSAGRTGVIAGSSLGALIFSYLINHASFHFAVGTLCGLWLGIGFVLMMIRESQSDAFLSWRNREPKRQAETAAPTLAARPLRPLESAKAFALRIKEALSTSVALKLCALFLAVDFFLTSFGINLNIELLQKYGWTDESLSRFQGIFYFIGGTVLSLGIGYFSDRIGHFRALRILLGLCAFVFATIAFLFFQGWGHAVSPLIVALQVAVPSFIYVAAVPAILSLEHSPAAATRFTLIMNAMDFGDLLGNASAGHLTSHLSPPVFACVVAGVMITGSLVLRRPKKKSASARDSMVLVPEMPAIAA